MRARAHEQAMGPREALALFSAALRAADPERAVLRARLGSSAKVLQGPVKAIAVGKAARAMLKGLKRRVALSGGRITEAWVVSPEPKPKGSPARVHWLRSSHPVPTAASVRAARALERALCAAQSGERWVVLLSGGASALIGAPRPGLSLSDVAKTTQALLRAGAPIEEINALRKHLSLLGGGGMLARLGRKAGRPIEVLTLALSDVPSDRLDTIGSGPSVLDPTSFAQCLRITRRYRLELPSRVSAYLKDGARGAKPETLKRLPRNLRARQLIIASAAHSLTAAAKFAKAKGYKLRVLGVLEGDTHREARKQVLRSRGRLLLSGGELTVQVRGKGKGGRNQEFVLATLLEFAKSRGSRFLVFSAGTDGRDGNTPAAGAWADERTLAYAARKGVDPARFLAANDSHTFFKRVGGLITTGPTGTNVMDLRLVLSR